MQQQQLSDYDNIYKTLNEYYNSFIQNYANSKNIYVRETYAQLVDAMDQINKARHSTLTNLSTSMLEKNMRDEEYEREARRLASTGGD